MVLVVVELDLERSGVDDPLEDVLVLLSFLIEGNLVKRRLVSFASDLGMQL